MICDTISIFIRFVVQCRDILRIIAVTREGNALSARARASPFLELKKIQKNQLDSKHFTDKPL